MTRDAKIGLLLGLVFIFLIAFVINGLPTLRNDTNNNELTTNMISSRNNPPGIGTGQRKISRRLINPTSSPPAEQHSQTGPAPTQNHDNDIRYSMPLPGSASANKNTAPHTEISRAAVSPPTPPPPQKRTARNTRLFKQPTLPKIYVVRDGDCLAAIAKKFYGPIHGNKLLNITAIFQANRSLLRSPDEIYVGQKLLIPPLPPSASDKSETKLIFPATMFEKVKSIGRRRNPDQNRKTQQNTIYIVREGDSLWQIAAEKLGDGKRYTEIAGLNDNILNDEDSIRVGMILKLPPR